MITRPIRQATLAHGSHAVSLEPVRRKDASCQQSQISLCQEGKSSPDALRRSAHKSLFKFFGSRLCLSAIVLAICRTRHPFAVLATIATHRRLSYGSPASLETIRWEYREPKLRHPVGNSKTWQAACRINSFVLPRGSSKQPRSFPSRLPENLAGCDRVPRGRTFFYRARLSSFRSVLPA